MRPSVYGAWAGYWAMNPWGEGRADLRSAIVARNIANGLLKKAGGGAWCTDDFMPYLAVDEAARNRTLSQRIRSVFAFIGKRKKADT